jgi:O-acetyl-ADP-ribose deacetylase (regulator of RNase III)
MNPKPQEKLKVRQGDITQLEVDALVNAANTSLLGGGGVDGAIHRAAGPLLLKECKALGGCATGEAKLTQGYQLPAKFVIHTVGPIWQGGTQNEPDLLAACYKNSLKLAVKAGVKTLAFPAISCGAYGYPIQKAALIAVTETAAFIKLHNSLETIYFVCFDATLFETYTHLLEALHHD